MKSKEYPDAIESSLAATSELLAKHNFYTGNGLREYLRDVFPGSCVLECHCRGNEITAITSKMAYPEEQRQLSMIPGTTVKMQARSAEGKLDQYKDKEFVVTHGPQWMCGNWVVWMEGFSGAYSCDLLDIVNLKQGKK